MTNHTDLSRRLLLWVDEAGDREVASDRQSRYGAYLRYEAHRFSPDSDSGPATDPAEFAGLAFQVACSPVMSPGYVRTHPRVAAVRWRWEACVELELVAPHPPSVRDALASWPGWRTVNLGGDQGWIEPDHPSRPVAFTTVTVRVPIHPAGPVGLPSPAYGGGAAGRLIPDVDVAKLAVAAVCGQVNQHANRLLDALATPGRGWS
jgi:hypothetical protein